MAPGAAPKPGASEAATVDLPVPEGPPIAIKRGGGGHASDSAVFIYCRAIVKSAETIALVFDRLPRPFERQRQPWIEPGAIV